MLTVVSDTGPILHLAEADALQLLKYAPRVLIPPSVEAEMLSLDSNWHVVRPPWISVVNLSQRHVRDAQAWVAADLLDAGEAEAVALARQAKAHWFLTDDAAAALFARSLGMEVHGSLGVVLWCVAKGYLAVEEGRAALQRLRASSLWLSDRVMREALAALAEMEARDKDWSP